LQKERCKCSGLHLFEESMIKTKPWFCASTTAQFQAFLIYITMKYIKLSNETPTIEEYGEKVLVWRIMNQGQQDQNPSILPISMLKQCNKNETWWCELPNNPHKKEQEDANNFESFKKRILDDIDNINFDTLIGFCQKKQHLDFFEGGTYYSDCIEFLKKTKDEYKGK